MVRSGSCAAPKPGPLLAKCRGMYIKRLLLAVSLIGVLLFSIGCEETPCVNPDEELSVQLGYPGMGEWLPIEEGDDVLVAPGSQGWGLMVEVNIRIAGLSAKQGAYSTASVRIVRLSEAREQLTAPGTRMLAALCQDDGALMSRNRRVEFGEDYMVFEELEGIEEGFDAILSIDVEFHDGTLVSHEVEVHLYRDEAPPPEEPQLG